MPENTGRKGETPFGDTSMPKNTGRKGETPFGDTSMPFGSKEETRNDRNTEKPVSREL